MNKPISTPTPEVQVSPSPFNPAVVYELKLSKDGEEWLRTISPSLFQNYDQIQKYWNAPSTQFALTLVKDSELRAATDQMVQSRLTGQFIGYELVLLLFLWIVRAWRLGKVSTLLTRIWTQIWIGFIYWMMAVFLVPSLVLGEAYRTVVSHLSKAIFRHFFA